MQTLPQIIEQHIISNPSDKKIAEFLLINYPQKPINENHLSRPICELGFDTVRRYVTKIRNEKNRGRGYTKQYENKGTVIKLDKKMGEVNWRDWINLCETTKELHEKASWSQSKTEPLITTDLKKIILQPFSDIHLGSIATDHTAFREFTDFLLKTDNLIICLVGDLADNFVNFRNVLTMHQQILSPEQQDEVLESWINEIKHKVLFATWGNHEEFEEKASGRNIIKRILKHNVVYMNGIGYVKAKINDVEYKFAVTHKTRYSSSFNLTHGLKQLGRKDIPDADIYIAGDKHVPDKETFFERGEKKLAIQLGTLKTDCGYSKRYFAYKTSSAMPCVVLDTTSKMFTDFWTLEEALYFCR